MDWRIYGEYGDVTINFPKYSLDDGECFLSADCQNLINEMVKNGYLEITGQIKVNYGTYKIGKFTQKFADEFENILCKWIFSKRKGAIKMLEKLVGRRYANLELLKNDIELLTKRDVKSIIESESDRLEECDFMIDFCFEDNEWDIDTIYYLKDNAGQYYITEV